MGHVIWQNTDAQVVDHTLQHAIIIVYRQRGLRLITYQFLHQSGANCHLRRIWVLANQTVLGHIIEGFRIAARV